MQDTLLPLFPLRLVLLPGSSLPLHIFEDRYKELIGEAVKNNTEFGIVQAGDNGILNIGCTAAVQEVVNRYPDGRLDIVTAGRRRFEIIMLDEEKSYLRASVAFFADDDTAAAPEDLRKMTLAGLKLIAGTGPAIDLPEVSDSELSYRVGEHINDLHFRQMLLSLRSETERLRHIAAFLPEYIAKLRRTAHINKIAPTNGHGHVLFKEPE
jgi:Lon protease-like protein